MRNKTCFYNSYVGNLGDNIKKYLRIYFKDYTNEKNYTNNACYINGIVTYIISKKKKKTHNNVFLFGEAGQSVQPLEIMDA